jgi:hypothetical protein
MRDELWQTRKWVLKFEMVDRRMMMKCSPAGDWHYYEKASALGPTQPPIQWVPEVISLGVKRPGREADHSPSSSAEFKNAWSYNSTPEYASMA